MDYFLPLLLDASLLPSFSLLSLSPQSFVAYRSDPDTTSDLLQTTDPSSTATNAKSMSGGTRKKALGTNKVQLLFCKSKVYLHPTTAKSDNVPGYLTLTKGAGATNRDVVLSFTAQDQLAATDKKFYDEVDLQDLKSGVEADIDFPVVAKPPVLVLLGYSFSIPLSYIYSVQIRTPSAGWWHGSVVINTKDGEKLPIVFFHDNESPSTIRNQKARNQTFDPFGENGEMYWGGHDFVHALRAYAVVERTAYEPSVHLVNPESRDLINFAPKKEIARRPEKFQLPDVNKIIANAKWKVLETVATLSARTKNQVIDLVEEHAPVPIKQLVAQPEVQRIGNEFEGARVYFAKWAAQVKEEAEEARRAFTLDDDMYSTINKELGSDLLTSEEVSKVTRRKPVSTVEWDNFFDLSGRLCITVDEVKDRIFHGGLDDSVRGKAWLFLLGVYPWDSSAAERKVLRGSYASEYERLKLQWVTDDSKRTEEFWKDQKHRIEKDINRTDRTLSLFKNKRRVTVTSIGSNVLPTTRESSPETPDEEDSDEFDVANIRNPHLFAMREILLTYNEYNVNLGYVQGMTDLLSPLYVKFQDEPLTFWAFSKFMERMERNFVRDQSGMKKQMVTLNELVQFMMPKLYEHLGKCESTDLFFYFRMLLVWFKREFEWNDTLRLWEILWTDRYSSQFHLFFALSVLSDNERIIIENLRRFDEVLKYINDLSMHMNLDHLLVRSELLFLRFRRMVDLVDRESQKRDEAINISPDLRELLSKDLVVQKEVPRPEGVGGG